MATTKVKPRFEIIEVAGIGAVGTGGVALIERWSLLGRLK